MSGERTILKSCTEPATQFTSATNPD